MGFDPNQFTLQLIESLGSQINQGRQQVKEQQVLNELLPQLQQAQNPEEILNIIAQAQLQQGLPQQTKQNLLGLANPIAQLQRSQEANEQKQREIERRVNEVEEKKRDKLRRELAPLQSALKSVDRMVELRANNNLGKGGGAKAFAGTFTSGLIFADAPGDLGEYKRNALSLISIANQSGVVIRNIAEFNALTEDLRDPFISDGEAAGLLKSLREEIEGSIEALVPKSEEGEKRVKVMLDGKVGTVPESQVEFLRSKGGQVIL